MVKSFYALNLQQSRGCWLRTEIESNLPRYLRLYMQTSGSSFDTFFLWRGGQVDHESIQLGLMMT